MGVYHITYAPGPREVYLYFEAECNLSCWGCIAKFHPIAFRLKEEFSSYNILLTNGYKLVRTEVLDEICVSIKAVTEALF
ncbi:MAG: hypothetical protein DRI93_04800, partial [Aquificota bacterium]